MNLTKREKRRLRLGNTEHRSQEAQQETQKSDAKKIQAPAKSKYYAIAVAIGILIFLVVAYSVYSINKPGQYDNFAKCITQKGAVMYGAMNWCKFTQAQKAMFGNSFKYIDYHEFSKLAGIKKTPTWVINGQWHENVQSFEKLAELTGCRL